MARRVFDIAIIGGGVNGCAIARDAATGGVCIRVAEFGSTSRTNGWSVSCRFTSLTSPSSLITGTESTVGAEWTVPRISNLFLDARVTASAGQWADTAETQSIPAYARLDIGGRYTFKTRLPSTLRVNIDNVTGANYWESAFNGLAYTGPRTLRISGGIRF